MGRRLSLRCRDSWIGPNELDRNAERLETHIDQNDRRLIILTEALVSKIG